MYHRAVKFYGENMRMRRALWVYVIYVKPVGSDAKHYSAIRMKTARQYAIQPVRTKCSFANIQSLGRVGKLDSLFFEATENGKVDLLLYVHVNIVVATQHVIHAFEVERGIAVFMKMSPVESSFVY